jgi:hypothetical protein
MSGDKYTYAVLQETSGDENETWLYFLRYQGNEQNLKDLKNVFDSIEWELFEDASVFDIDIDNLVSEVTAKEMTKLELNYFTYHRKFDGTLQNIDFRFKKNCSNKNKIYKITKYLGFGQIEDFISDEDTHEGMKINSDISDTENEQEQPEEDLSSSEEDKKKSFLPYNLQKKKK